MKNQYSKCVQICFDAVTSKELDLEKQPDEMSEPRCLQGAQQHKTDLSRL